jgi:flagellar motor component MotA
VLTSLRVFFREFFVFHHRSLEFRAKIFAAMMSVNMDNVKEETKALKEIASDIYKDDEVRQDILLRTVLEYLKKVEHKEKDTDNIILEVDRCLKQTPRYYKKIDLKHLTKFKKYSNNESDLVIQTRILEFFEHSKKLYKFRYEAK